MRNEKLLRILFNIQTFLGLWPKRISRCHYICAVSFFYSIVLINTIPQFLSLSEVENVEEFIKIFFILPSLFILVTKFTTFVFLNDEIARLLNAINGMYNDYDFSPFKKTAMSKVHKLIAFYTLAVLMAFPGSAIDSLITRETTLTIPKSWRKLETSFWFCYVDDRLSTIYIPMIMNSIDLLISISIVLFDGFAKLNAARMRKLQLDNKMDLIKIIEYHIKLRK